MASVVEICNRALSNIGNSRSINSLNEASKEAGECSLHFDACRDSVLSDFDWNFATKRIALADTSSSPPDWRYAYRYPTDCVRIIEIMVPGVRNPTAAQRVQYEVGADADGTGKLIYADQQEAWMKYVGRVTDVNMYDAIFAEALAWRLSAAINMALTGNADLGNNALNMYGRVIMSAGSHSMNESQEPTQPDSEFTCARLS
ncbi:hypothetical protein DZA65_03190 [Dickeya dianthicola]|uniref:hypothetical protein n=1 Tax=Dickeya dianthicola TaxID=204039 RepID=UPI000CD43439|nr:hypothetical protein [Dickeya dianthicola]AYC20065.1 hypothetical protein DZA65_03190 [Dickeya dianthicola]MBI0437114.1 hypothetical protein [Dickeya dianthicola]MBI0448648.1 hypothetical protein [Dickeya dianthicola]MBI0452075.1 hypothetical protein [Dickeya dianthicola]MBI0456347.1 hypothetical protein [Dickeya dianthicola]